MHMGHKLALACVLGALAISGLGHDAHAAGMKTYTNKAHGYTMQYPLSWTQKPHADNSDVEFASPDTNAIVVGTATLGSASQAAIKAQQAKVLKGLGTPQGPLSFKVATINGVSYQVSELVTKIHGRMIDALLLDTVHGAYLYDFEAFLAFNKPSTKLETAIVDQMLNSIQLTN